MHPWSWIWSPHLHLPFSGDLNQRIAPETNWFAEHIRGDVGQAEVEQRAFEQVASYGKQLGLITEVLLGMRRNGALTPEKARQSLLDLARIHADIERLKPAAKVSAVAVERQLELLRRDSPADYARILGRSQQVSTTPAPKADQ